jgi:hypothetical protein
MIGSYRGRSIGFSGGSLCSKTEKIWFMRFSEEIFNIPKTKVGLFCSTATYLRMQAYQNIDGILSRDKAINMKQQKDSIMGHMQRNMPEAALHAM